jgi:hypothetical protein
MVRDQPIETPVAKVLSPIRTKANIEIRLTALTISSGSDRRAPPVQRRVSFQKESQCFLSTRKRGAVLEAENEGRRTAAAVPSPAVAVPASLHAWLMARLDRLGPAKGVAQIGAAIGRQFSHALLAALVRRLAPHSKLIAQSRARSES